MPKQNADKFASNHELKPKSHQS